MKVLAILLIIGFVACAFAEEKEQEQDNREGRQLLVGGYGYPSVYNHGIYRSSYLGGYYPSSYVGYGGYRTLGMGISPYGYGVGLGYNRYIYG